LTCCVIFAIWVSEESAESPKSGKNEELDAEADAVDGVEVIELFSTPYDIPIGSKSPITVFGSKIRVRFQGQLRFRDQDYTYFPLVRSGLNFRGIRIFSGQIFGSHKIRKFHNNYSDFRCQGQMLAL